MIKSFIVEGARHVACMHLQAMHAAALLSPLFALTLVFHFAMSEAGLPTGFGCTVLLLASVGMTVWGYPERCVYCLEATVRLPLAWAGSAVFLSPFGLSWSTLIPVSLALASPYSIAPNVPHDADWQRRFLAESVPSFVREMFAQIGRGIAYTAEFVPCFVRKMVTWGVASAVCALPLFCLIPPAMACGVGIIVGLFLVLAGESNRPSAEDYPRKKPDLDEPIED